MKALFTEIRGAVMSTLVLAVVCCGIYPLVVFGISQVAFRDKANGSLIVAQDGTIRGSTLLGQNFTAEKYFHPRPSAAGNGYDAANSSGSNLGPTSQKLNDAIKDRIAAYRAENGLKETDTRRRPSLSVHPHKELPLPERHAEQHHFEIFVTTIILDGNSQVCLHKPMVKAALVTSNHARPRAYLAA